MWQPYVVNDVANRVERYARPGELAWFTPIKDPLGPRSLTSIVSNEKTVFVGSTGGVVALEVNSGRLRWQIPEESGHLLLFEDLLLAIQRDSTPSGGRGTIGLVARRLGTGEPVFKVALPEHGWVKDIIPLNGLILVSVEESGFIYTSLLVTPQGRVRNTFDRQVVAGCELAGAEYYLTDVDVRKLEAEGRECWRAPLPRSFSHAGGDLRTVDGDLVVALYERISDSGVQLARIGVDHGACVWATYCEGLHVEHSEYHHEAKVKLLDGRFLEVLSKGSRGSFVEMLDLSTGLSVLRKRF